MDWARCDDKHDHHCQSLTLVAAVKQFVKRVGLERGAWMRRMGQGRAGGWG